MEVLHNGANRTFFKLIVVGDRDVGKTSLIQTMKEGFFREKWDNYEENLVRKVFYWHEEKIFLQLGELHLDELREMPDWAEEAKGVLLLYDKENEETIDTIKTKWYSLVNKYFVRAPLFLIRTKAEEVKEETRRAGRRLRQEINAVGFFDCSSKENRDVEKIFLEIIKYHKKQEAKKVVAEANDPFSAGSSWSQLRMVALNSGPLLRQAIYNLRECVTNPLAFIEQKQAIKDCFPFFSCATAKKERKFEENEQLTAKKGEKKEVDEQ